MNAYWYKKLLFAVFFVVIFQHSKATVIIIYADSSRFTPDTAYALIGDTIRFVWVMGIHTTTSNGIPAAAEPWNELLDSAHTQFTYPITEGGTYNFLSVPDIPI